ncbi:MAG: cation:proton antiporter [Gemmatimonadetes bacterium]|nr:cation:proton antiporter [Gemmatimonadota bacterium]
MHEATDFLRNLAVVLGVAAATTVIFQRLRQPVIFGYLLAGLIIGPHVPVPVVVDQGMVQTLSELGVILVMFSLGLEFSIRKIVEVAPTGGLIALSETSAMLVFGYLVGQIFGWTTLESLFAGAIVAISSTTIVLKAFEEQGVRGKATELVFGILIGEDLIAIFLLATLTAVASGAGVSTGSLALTAMHLVAFLAGLVILGLLVVPRLVRYVMRLNRPETTLVACIGICFACALLALEFGYSVALGAFIAGALVAESGQVHAIEPLIRPVRDLFAAIFFVAVGMLIEPALVARNWLAVVVLTLVVVVGKVVAVSMAAFLAGNEVRTATRTGMSLAQIGEFSFIIAGIGLSLGATREFLYPVAIAVSAITTLVTPWLIRASAPAALFVDRKLPKPLQTFAALYGSWIGRLRAGGREAAGRRRIRRAVRVLALDAALLAAVAIGESLEEGRIAQVLSAWTGLAPSAARLLVEAGALLIAAPLVFGIVRNARVLAVLLAVSALPHATRGVDLAAAPRRAMIVALQLLIVFLVGAPLIVVTQPFLPPFRGAAALAVVVGTLWVAVWRSARNLQGHARAGAEVIVAALEHQMAAGAEPAGAAEDTTLARLHRLLPGLGEPVPVRIGPSSPAAGRTLAELNLRGQTGATVLAIVRDGQEVLLPVGKEALRPGDLLALAGAPDAIAAAEEMLGAAPHEAARPVRTLDPR